MFLCNVLIYDEYYTVTILNVVFFLNNNTVAPYNDTIIIINCEIFRTNGIQMYPSQILFGSRLFVVKEVYPLLQSD